MKSSKNQKPSGEINRLMQVVAERFVFDESNYPELKGAGDKEQLVFAVRHSALHFAKTSGKIAAVSEDTDHGGLLDVILLRTHTVKALIDILRLAELIGMTEEDMITAIEKKCGQSEKH